MSRVLKYILTLLRVTGFCSLKGLSSRERHGWLYYVWSLLISIVFCMEMFNMDVPPSVLLGLIIQSFICTVLKLHILSSDNILIDILNGFDSFDVKLSFPVSEVKSKWTRFLVIWLIMQFSKMIWVHVQTHFVRLGLHFFILLIFYSCIPILAVELYHQIFVRFSTICHYLYLKTTKPNVSSEELVFDIELARSLYLSLHQLTCLVNSYLGVPLFVVILSLTLDIYTRIHNLYYNPGDISIFKLFVSSPVEFLLVYYLTMKTDSIVEQVSVILMELKTYIRGFLPK